MPIFMNYEGIRGNVSHAHRGGVNTMMGDGSVRGLKDSINRSFGGTSNGGVWKTTNFLHPAAPNVIEVSRISLPNAILGFDFIDGRDMNAASKTRMMIETQRSGGNFTLTFQGQTTGAANNMQSLNNFRQIAVSGRTIPLIKIFVGNGGNSNRVAVGLENVKVTSYQLSGHEAATVSLSLNFGKIEYRTLSPDK